VVTIGVRNEVYVGDVNGNHVTETAFPSLVTGHLQPRIALSEIHFPELRAKTLYLYTRIFRSFTHCLKRNIPIRKRLEMFIQERKGSCCILLKNCYIKLEKPQGKQNIIQNFAQVLLGQISLLVLELSEQFPYLTHVHIA